jgi:hypothetical protein
MARMPVKHGHREAHLMYNKAGRMTSGNHTGWAYGPIQPHRKLTTAWSLLWTPGL